MDIFSACPFAVASLGWDPGPYRRSLSVCVKGTFVLSPGGAPCGVAPLQEPVRVGDGGSALGSASGAAPDLVPFKPRVDVLVVGHAHAPGGAPTDSLIARVRVGAFRKSLSINGDRSWVPSFDGLRPSVAVPFRRMPLDYERAVRTGENLTGVDISQGAEPNRPLANIAAIADQGGETPGLGPIPLGWRALRLGIGDAGLLWASRAGLAPGPPPTGFDFRVFNAAPTEQQLDELTPGAEVVLENLHPDHPRLETRLPPLRVRMFRRAPDSEASTEVAARCDTLWIDTDRGLLTLLWRGAVLLEGADEAEAGRLVVTAELPGERIGVAEVDHMLARFAPTVTYVDASAVRGAPGGIYPRFADPIPLPDAPVTQAPREAPRAAGPRETAPPPPPEPVDSYPPPPPIAKVAPEESLDAPTPPPGARRALITLAPFEEEPSSLAGLPFRAARTGFEVPRAEAPADDEMTPPRGYPSLSALGVAAPVGAAAAPASAPAAPPEGARFETQPPPAELMAPEAARFETLPPQPPQPPQPPAAESDPYFAVKMEAWRSQKALGEVLARHGIDEAAFHAHEAAQAEVLAREGAEGRSEVAIAMIEALSAAERAG